MSGTSDPIKRRRWLLAAAILHDETQQMGEVVVITASASVARRARNVAHVRGPPLRQAQWRAILDVLSDKMLSRLREAAMHPDRVTERPAVRKTRLLLESIGEKRGLEQGRAETARGALLVVLSERGLGPTDEERARIEACTDVEQLGLWHRRAVTAASVAEVLAATVTAARPAPKPRRTRPSPVARTSR